MFVGLSLGTKLRCRGAEKLLDAVVAERQRAAGDGEGVRGTSDRRCLLSRGQATMSRRLGARRTR